MQQHKIPGRRGGPRPGAGAPRGNTNALVTGRYSGRYPQEAAILVRVLPAYRRRLDTLFHQDRAEFKRLMDRYLPAAHHVIGVTPDLPERIEAVILTNAHLIRLLESGEGLLRYLLQAEPQRVLARSLSSAGWLINREPFLARALIDVIQPPFEAALAALYPPAAHAEKTPPKNNQTIKQPQIESAAPPSLIVFPRTTLSLVEGSRQRRAKRRAPVAGGPRSSKLEARSLKLEASS